MNNFIRFDTENVDWSADSVATNWQSGADSKLVKKRKKKSQQQQYSGKTDFQQENVLPLKTETLSISKNLNNFVELNTWINTEAEKRPQSLNQCTSCLYVHWK